MNTYRIETSSKLGIVDSRGVELLRQIAALGVDNVHQAAVTDLYFLAGNATLDRAAAARLAAALLHDPVVARVEIIEDEARRTPVDDVTEIEVTLLPGVTDSVAESLLAGAQLIGVTGLEQAATGHRYTLRGNLSEVEVIRIARGLLANEVIQRFSVNRPAEPPFVAFDAAAADVDVSTAAVEVIPLTHLDGDGLLALSRTRRLSLDRAEMEAVQRYYCREGREPTDVELEMLAQTWSEHCVHKTFKAIIEYSGPNAGPIRHQLEQNQDKPTPDDRPPITVQRIDGLLKTYIRAATERAAKPWVRSAFVDNAGIVAFDEQYDLAFKVETHNHPSALEPFGGANTGVGGVVRDVMGVSARPIANTDVLFFGPRDLTAERLPAGVLHPRRVADGVTAGIEDYGNKMGIPTVNGAIVTDPAYTANPLVFCGCLGILPHGSHRTEPQGGDLVVVIGGRTGRDGLRGATFSSMEMDHHTSALAGSAVQIGHPIHEKQALEAILLARDEGLYHAITDCGAGGLSSAVGEMAAELGAVVHLERAPLKYPGLRPWEIWLSEAQERMVLAVPPMHWPRLQVLCAGLDVSATALGEFTGDGRVRILYRGRTVGDLDADFLHNGIPRRHLQAEWQPEPRPMVTGHRSIVDFSQALLVLLALPEIRSKEDVVRRYDHEVQGGTWIKPLVGAANTGPGDAAVLAPLDALRAAPSASASVRGVALSVGTNPFYTELDPYCMAWAAVDEAVRNAVAVGADPDYLALLDNFSWGNPTLPDRLGSLVRCVQGCCDAATAFHAPFISGKDSLNNEYTGADSQKHAIPGTLVISALAIVPNLHRAVTMDCKAAGNRLYAIGASRGELGGSALERELGRGESHPHPQPLSLRGRGESDPPLPLGEGLGVRAAPLPPTHALQTYRALHRAMVAGLVRACHDCSEGGVAVAAAEMALAGGLGVSIALASLPRDPSVDDAGLAFGESLGRLLVEVSPQHAALFEAEMAGAACACVGEVRGDDRIVVTGLMGNTRIDVTLAAVEGAWRGVAIP